MTDIQHSGTLEESLKCGSAVRQTEWLIEEHCSQDRGWQRLGIWDFTVTTGDAENNRLENGDFGDHVL